MGGAVGIGLAVLMGQDADVVPDPGKARRPQLAADPGQIRAAFPLLQPGDDPVFLLQKEAAVFQLHKEFPSFQ